jgi:hypothetical protein
MWRAIEHESRRGAQTLDFGRTSLHNEGLRRYKLNWGSEEKTINYLKWDSRHGRFIQGKDRSSGFQNLAFRRLPALVSRAAGRFLYPHIA